MPFIRQCEASLMQGSIWEVVTTQNVVSALWITNTECPITCDSYTPGTHLYRFGTTNNYVDMSLLAIAHYFMTTDWDEEGEMLHPITRQVIPKDDIAAIFLFIDHRLVQWCEHLSIDPITKHTILHWPADVLEIQYTTTLLTFALHICDVLHIPASVTKIGSGACKNNVNLLQVIIAPSSQLQSIMDEAFADATKLESFECPDAVQYIGDRAFVRCKRLSAIVWSTESKLQHIDFGAFMECSQLQAITLPKHVNRLGAGAFQKCVQLHTVHIQNEGLISCEGNIFENCLKLETVVIQKPNFNLECEMFQHCISLKNVIFKETATNPIRILARAFKNCNKLCIFTCPENVLSIGSECFKDCYNLKTFHGGATLESVFAEAFMHTNSLQAAYFPSTIHTLCPDIFAYSGINKFTWNFARVDTIPRSMFRNCSLLERIIMESPVQHIEDYAFINTPKLTEIVNLEEHLAALKTIGDHVFVESGIEHFMMASTVESVGNGVFSHSMLQTCIWHNSDRCIAIGDNIFNACSLQTFHIPNSWTSVPKYTFSKCKALTTVTTDPDNNVIQTIDKDAFSGSGVVRYDLPATIRVLGERCFADCEHLQEVHYATDQVQKINIHCRAFMNTPALLYMIWPKNCEIFMSGTSIFMNSGLKYIEWYSGACIPENCFYGCQYLLHVTLPGTIKRIARRAFQFTKSLTTLTWHGDPMLTHIEEFVFYGSGLPEITIPPSVFWIGDGVFQGSQLHTCRVSASEYVYLGYKMFENATSLKAFHAPKGWKLSHRMFAHCTSLTTVTIDAAITDIGVQCFHQSGITSLDVPDTVTILLSGCMKECYALQSVTFTANSQCRVIENEAFAHSGLVTFSAPPCLTKLGALCFNACQALSTVCASTATLTTIGKGAFKGTSSLQQISLGPNVTLAEQMFCNSGLTYFRWYALHWKVMPAQIFYGCKDLLRIDVESPIEEIQWGALQNTNETLQLHCETDSVIQSIHVCYGGIDRPFSDMCYMDQRRRSKRRRLTR